MRERHPLDRETRFKDRPYDGTDFEEEKAFEDSLGDSDDDEQPQQPPLRKEPSGGRILPSD